MGKDPPHKYDVYLIKVLSFFIKEMIVKNPGFLPKSFPSCNQSWLDLVETLILTVIAKLLSPQTPLHQLPQARATILFMENVISASSRKLFCNFWMF